MKPKTQQALESIAQAGKDGVAVKSVHWRVRDSLIADDFVKVTLRKVKGSEPIELLVATAEGKKALKAAQKSAAKLVNA